MGETKGPEELWALLDEFLAVTMEEDFHRKMTLGAALNQERRLLIVRLLDNVEMVCRDPYPDLMNHWLELRKVYRKIDDALAVPNEEELRIFAARHIFQADKEEQMELDIDVEVEKRRAEWQNTR